jgi:hypothetical protein
VSLITEFFVADAAAIAEVFAGWTKPVKPSIRGSIPPPGPESPEVPYAEPRLGAFPRLQLKGISAAEITTLHRAALPDIPMVEMIRPALIAPGGRLRWIYLIPEPLLAVLVTRADDVVLNIGKKWAALERERIDEVDSTPARLSRIAHHREAFWTDTLGELVTLATVAKESASSLYMLLRY